MNSGSPLSFPVCSNKTKGGVTQDDFKRNIALQHCRDIVSNSCNIFPTLRYIKSGRFIEILWAFLIKELFHSRLLDEMIIANSALRALLASYHLISNALSWNNC